MAALYINMIGLEDVKNVLNTDQVFEPKIDPVLRDTRSLEWKEAVKRSLNWIRH